MPRYVVTVNRPGYLPDYGDEPGAVFTLEAARATLRAEIETSCEAATDDGRSTNGYAEALAAAEGANQDETIIFAGYAHTITLDG